MTVQRRGGDLTWALGLLVLVYLAGISAVYFAPDSSAVATWWPAAGSQGRGQSTVSSTATPASW